MPAIQGLNHANVLTCDPNRTLEFYRKLGFRKGYRPTGFPDEGFWLYAGNNDYQILHINIVDHDQFTALGSGVYNHIGFEVSGTIEEVVAWLNDQGIAPDVWAPIPGAHRALYFTGPSGEKVELVFIDEPVASFRDATVT